MLSNKNTSAGYIIVENTSGTPYYHRLRGLTLKKEEAHIYSEKQKDLIIESNPRFGVIDN
jgi:hypothetical protein